MGLYLYPSQVDDFIYFAFQKEGLASVGLRDEAKGLAIVFSTFTAFEDPYLQVDLHMECHDMNAMNVIDCSYLNGKPCKMEDYVSLEMTRTERVMIVNGILTDKIKDKIKNHYIKLMEE